MSVVVTVNVVVAFVNQGDPNKKRDAAVGPQGDPHYLDIMSGNNCCHGGRRLPKTRLDFWRDKLDNNAQRDKKNLSALRSMGWTFLVIWKCETNDEKSWRIARSDSSR